MGLLIAQSYKDQQQKLLNNNVFFPEMAASALKSNNSRSLQGYQNAYLFGQGVQVLVAVRRLMLVDLP